MTPESIEEANAAERADAEFEARSANSAETRVVANRYPGSEHSEICSWRFGMSRDCDCKVSALEDLAEGTP